MRTNDIKEIVLTSVKEVDEVWLTDAEEAARLMAGEKALLRVLEITAEFMSALAVWS